MSMVEKIGEWYDAHNNMVFPGRNRPIQIPLSVENLHYAEDVLYGEGGRLAKIGGVTSPVAKAAILGETQNPEI